MQNIEHELLYSRNSWMTQSSIYGIKPNNLHMTIKLILKLPTRQALNTNSSKKKKKYLVSTM